MANIVESRSFDGEETINRKFRPPSAMPDDVCVCVCVSLSACWSRSVRTSRPWRIRWTSRSPRASPPTAPLTPPPPPLPPAPLTQTLTYGPHAHARLRTQIRTCTHNQSMCSIDAKSVRFRSDGNCTVIKCFHIARVLTHFCVMEDGCSIVLYIYRCEYL